MADAQRPDIQETEDQRTEGVNEQSLRSRLYPSLSLWRITAEPQVREVTFDCLCQLSCQSHVTLQPQLQFQPLHCFMSFEIFSGTDTVIFYIFCPQTELDMKQEEEVYPDSTSRFHDDHQLDLSSDIPSGDRVSKDRTGLHLSSPIPARPGAPGHLQTLSTLDLSFVLNKVLDSTTCSSRTGESLWPPRLRSGEKNPALTCRGCSCSSTWELLQLLFGHVQRHETPVHRLPTGELQVWRYEWAAWIPVKTPFWYVSGVLQPLLVALWVSASDSSAQSTCGLPVPQRCLLLWGHQ